MADISNATIENAAKLRPGLSHSSNGVIKEEVGNFEKVLEGQDKVTMDNVNDVLDIIKSATEGFTLAACELGEDILKADKDLGQVTAQMAIGKGMAVDVAYNRETERRTSVKDATMIKVQGSTAIKVEFKGRKSAEMRRVRSAMAERAAKLFG